MIFVCSTEPEVLGPNSDEHFQASGGSSYLAFYNVKVKSRGPQNPIIKIFQNSFDMIGVSGFDSIKLLPETWNDSI